VPPQTQILRPVRGSVVSRAVQLRVSAVARRPSSRLVIDTFAGSEPPEVSHDGWASEEEAYSFRYRHPDTHAGLLLKAVRMGGTLVLSTLSTSHPDVRFFEVE
jgi:hypothetical protein